MPSSELAVLPVRVSNAMVAPADMVEESFPQVVRASPESCTRDVNTPEGS